jgi:hypothetical protein
MINMYEMIMLMIWDINVCLTPRGVTASETVALPVSGTGTTETVPSSVASTNPSTLGVFQAQVTGTAAIVAITSSVSAPAPQTQTASLPRLSIEG